MDNIDTIMEKIEEILSDSKRVKFNTHKNRKVMLGEIKNTIIEGVRKKPIRQVASSITRPIPDKESKGFAVMTEGKSQMADELKKSMHPTKNEPATATVSQGH